MCAGAIVLARIPKLLLIRRSESRRLRTLYNIVQDDRLNHRVELNGGVLRERCGALLKEFFTKVRANGMGKP